MKFLVIAYGIICLLLAFLAQYFDSILQTSLIIFGVIGGPILAVFTMGVLLPHVNQKVPILSLVWTNLSNKLQINIILLF